jgi:hypothetical protein
MFSKIQMGMTASLAAALMTTVPVMAQQYPPPPQQAPQYPQQQPPPPPPPPGQYPPQQAGQYPPQQPGQYPPQQDPFNQPANFAPQQLDQMVSRIALYPDPLLAQIFAAASFPDQIQPAAQWADQHHYLTGAALAQAIQGDQLPFDPSVQSLLPFPSVLDMMASDMNWTSSIGNAFLSQGAMLQDSVQRMRHQAYNYGYLRTNPQVVVNGGPYISIYPADPGYIVVPYYDPAIVFYRPWRPGFVGISFGFGVGIGGFFNPWGWGGARFAWESHGVFINNAVWGRTWANRGVYVHPYAGVVRRPWVGAGAYRASAAGRPESHPLEGRSAPERAAARTGRPVPREGHGGHDEHRH